jgi:hypothetical protein
VPERIPLLLNAVRIVCFREVGHIKRFLAAEVKRTIKRDRESSGQPLDPFVEDLVFCS